MFNVKLLVGCQEHCLSHVQVALMQKQLNVLTEFVMWCKRFPEKFLTVVQPWLNSTKGGCARMCGTWNGMCFFCTFTCYKMTVLHWTYACLCTAIWTHGKEDDMGEENRANLLAKQSFMVGESLWAILHEAVFFNQYWLIFIISALPQDCFDSLPASAWRIIENRFFTSALLHALHPWMLSNKPTLAST